MEARQLFAGVTAAAAQPTGAPLIARSCGGLNLPMGGILSMPNGELVTLTAAAAFKPVCTPVIPPAIIANGGGGSVSIDDNIEGSMPTDDGWTFSDYRDPFYASTFPQFYALAATTVVAYTLVIMLFVTPRSFLDGGVVVLGGRGFTNGGTGPTIGGRPWLQKVAALAVAISLTIASAATFQAAEEQYSFGVQNAKRLQIEVLGGTELKIIRIISNTFLWLAQAQTLIRLFPRQREKVIIKWTAFALITLDVIFQSLNSFKYDQGVARPGSFQHAVPALSYLFALSLGVLYAAWVIYYSLLKKRYAFWHPQMKNMLLVAVLSLLAILIPVVFFILDMIQPEFTGWGEYVRWVGAAAASVIVWEWVERIEALEREEKKDGILGREVFDGDEMLEMARYNNGLRRRRKELDDDKMSSFDSGRDESPSTGRGNRWPAVTAITSRYTSRSRAAKPAAPPNTQPSNHDRIRFLQPPLWPARPPPAVSPVSRADTSSAASTVYAVRYHALTETTSRTPPPPQSSAPPLSRSNSITSSHTTDDDGPSEAGDTPAQPTQEATPAPPKATPSSSSSSSNRWRSITQRIPFQRPPRTTADVERGVPAAAAEENVLRQEGGSNGGGSSSSKWDLRSRLEDFAATQADRLRDKFGTTPDTDSLPVTVIPAPPRRGAALARLLEEEEEELETQGNAAAAIDRQGGGSVLRTAPPPPQGDDPPPPQLWPGGGVAARRESGSFAAPSRLSIPRAGTPSGHHPVSAGTPGSAGLPPSSS
ncbi:PalH/RIM21-domain-containing protein [Parachaetomium inaequale]|uniref:PalH/RIM21-domain-containing protein n=1 Tax=Parachaetomium inaequale TaxID=2588326 RepID=A0AAN6PPU4_9PEZI|nr:PalH/RIM21-domain-containing protein [Parachaetomium inaequale]